MSINVSEGEIVLFSYMFSPGSWRRTTPTFTHGINYNFFYVYRIDIIFYG